MLHIALRRRGLQFWMKRQQSYFFFFSSACMFVWRAILPSVAKLLFTRWKLLFFKEYRARFLSSLHRWSQHIFFPLDATNGEHCLLLEWTILFLSRRWLTLLRENLEEIMTCSKIFCFIKTLDSHVTTISTWLNRLLLMNKLYFSFRVSKYSNNNQRRMQCRSEILLPSDIEACDRCIDLFRYKVNEEKMVFVIVFR